MTRLELVDSNTTLLHLARVGTPRQRRRCLQHTSMPPQQIALPTRQRSDAISRTALARLPLHARVVHTADALPPLRQNVFLASGAPPVLELLPLSARKQLI